MTHADGFINTVQQLAHVKGVAVSGKIPGDELGRISNVNRTDVAMNNQATMNTMGVDTRFIDLYQMKLLVGRNFSPSDAYHALYLYPS